MTIILEEIIAATQHTFGLKQYYLHRHELSRDINTYNETIYSLSMEWYPVQHTKPEEDGLNPEGTAVIQYDLTASQYKAIIFVRGKSYAAGALLPSRSLDEVIAWVEQTSGLTYGEQFQRWNDQTGAFHFIACKKGIPLSPSGHIRVVFDEAGRLIEYTMSGDFHAHFDVEEENFTLSLEKVEEHARKQLQSIELPASEEQQLIALYGIKEIYITNDGEATLPFEFTTSVKSRVHIDKIIEWKQPSIHAFTKRNIHSYEAVTLEQAIAGEPHPDSFPIGRDELDNCISAVEEGLRQLYPSDSGQWVLKSLHRDRGYILATLRESKPSIGLYERKLLMFVDAERYEVVNYMDNKLLVSSFAEYEKPGEIVVSKDDAYHKLKGRIELTPVYVFDPERQKYLLCGKLDCQYAVNAVTGEVVALDSL